MTRLRDLALPTRVRVLTALAAALFPWLAIGQSDLVPPLNSHQRHDDSSRLAQVPLVFEPNRGQEGGRGGYVSRARNYTFLLSSAGAGFQLSNTAEAGATRVQMSFAGANQRAKGEAEDRQPGTSNYFIGNDPASWLTAVPHYGRIVYHNAYPGIDVVYYGNQNQIEYDMVLAPGADPSQIKLRFRGVRGLRIDESGNLVLGLGNGEIRQKKPVIYQKAADKVEYIDGSYVLVAAAK